MSKILVIDLGTTLFKFSIFDQNGQLRGCCRRTPPLERPRPGFLELPAGAFLAVIAEGIGQVVAEAGGSRGDIEAVTFATQTNSFVLLDADNRPVTPIILWPDGRARDLEQAIQALCNLPEFSATTGIPAVSNQFMLAKLAWLAQQQTKVWRRAVRLCLLSDYLTLAMTSRHVTEAGTVGLTGFVDIHNCRWWEPMLDRCGIAAMDLPKIVRAGTDLGALQPAAAETFGLPSTCRFIVGCLDQYAGAIGVGAVEPGMVAETTGTVLATVLCSDRSSTSVVPQVFQGPSYRDDRCWKMAFGDVSAKYLQWYRDQLPDRPEFEQLVSLVEAVPVGADSLKLRTSVGLTTLADVFSGQRPDHTRGHFVRAIMEAVADALADQVAILCEGRQGALPSEIRSAGGGAKSRAWLKIKADRLGIPVTATECPEPTSLGAAILAEAALGESDVPEIVRHWVRLQPSFR